MSKESILASGESLDLVKPSQLSVPEKRDEEVPPATNADAKETFTKDDSIYEDKDPISAPIPDADDARSTTTNTTKSGTKKVPLSKPEVSASTVRKSMLQESKLLVNTLKATKRFSSAIEPSKTSSKRKRKRKEPIISKKLTVSNDSKQRGEIISGEMPDTVTQSDSNNDQSGLEDVNNDTQSRTKASTISIPTQEASARDISEDTSFTSSQTKQTNNDNPTASPPIDVEPSKNEEVIEDDDQFEDILPRDQASESPSRSQSLASVKGEKSIPELPLQPTESKWPRSDNEEPVRPVSAPPSTTKVTTSQTSISNKSKKAPRILSRCYETPSKYCQEICEVFSDEEFQTVNIKKMFKLKPKPPERPPWRLTYKTGNECTGRPKCGGLPQSCCRSKSGSIIPVCTDTGCSPVVCKRQVWENQCRHKRYAKRKRACDEKNQIPKICGILFTRFRCIDPEDAPLMVEGYPTLENFPSLTNIDTTCEPELPHKRLFTEEPKCCNPPPVEYRCFGGNAMKCGMDVGKGKFKRRGRNSSECQTNFGDSCCGEEKFGEVCGTGASDFRTKMMSMMKEALNDGQAEPHVLQALEKVLNDMCSGSSAGAGKSLTNKDKQAQTFNPVSRPTNEQVLAMNDLLRDEAMPEDQINALMVRILDPKAGSTLTSECQQVFGNFVAQMRAAGNVSKEDAAKMMDIIAGPSCLTGAYKPKTVPGRGFPAYGCKLPNRRVCRPLNASLSSLEKRCGAKPMHCRPQVKQYCKPQPPPPMKVKEKKKPIPPPPRRKSSGSDGVKMESKDEVEELEIATSARESPPPVSEEEEELEWPTEGPRGPLEKTPSVVAAPKDDVKKADEDYKSPFKFKKVKPPELPCDVNLCKLPDCHPLKTPYPPQYRFDEGRMRRYMEQCHQLKKICSHPPGEQCWTPPPPPLPPEMRPKKPPFPPDPCHPQLFPGTNLGMGCSYGLPSGNCYGKYDSGRKPKESYFDCGGICPMSLLGDLNQPPPYVKPKKKKKKDEIYQFDYITVQRDKRLPQPEEKCVEDSDEECEEDNLRNGNALRAKDAYDPCKFEQPPAPEQILQFLQRPDVHVVKEQVVDIVKQYKKCGPPEKLVCQQEALYKKAEDGTITSQFVEGGTEPNAQDQWKSSGFSQRQGVETGGDSAAPDWDKELEKFIKSCNKRTCKKPGKPLPTGFFPCPLPEKTAVLCRVTDPDGMGRNVLQCQAVPIPTGHVGGAIQFGTEGLCVGSGGNVDTLGLITPPVGYGGYVPQQQQQQMSRQIVQGLPPPPPPPQSQIVYQFLPSNIPPPPPDFQQYGDSQQQKYLQATSQVMAHQMQSLLNHANANVIGYPAYAPNGTDKYAPSSTTHGASKTPKHHQQSKAKVPSASPSVPSSSNPSKTQSKTNLSKSSSRKNADYPYTCEIQYHEPIHGSIYGRVVTRKQPCRLVDPQAKPKSGHNPNCPVVMETPFFNPSCPQKGSKDDSKATWKNCEKKLYR